MISYVTGGDGDLQKGVASPDPRFTDNGDGTVTDDLTGLIWAKDANLGGDNMTWSDTIDYANNLSLGSEGCGTSYMDWRLPNRNELKVLLMQVITILLCLAVIFSLMRRLAITSGRVLRILKIPVTRGL